MKPNILKCAEQEATIERMRLQGITPRVAMIAFEARDPAKAFVKVPNEPGRWFYTDRCVVEVGCDLCGAGAGEPCFRSGQGIQRKYTSGTHYVRRLRWKATKRRDPGIHEEQPEAKPHIRLRAGKTESTNSGGA